MNQAIPFPPLPRHGDELTALLAGSCFCDVSGEAGLSVRTRWVTYHLPARAAGPVRAAVLDRVGGQEQDPAPGTPAPGGRAGALPGKAGSVLFMKNLNGQGR